MAPRSDVFELGSLRLTAGEGRQLELEVAIDPIELAGERYTVAPAPVGLAISKTTGDGYALRLSFCARLTGPCMRCLTGAEPELAVDAREVSQPGAGEELESPYVDRGELDLRDWARDALVLALPTRILCRPDCAGLCPVCGADLNQAGEEHQHEREPDPRWKKLAELKFDA